MNGANEGGPPVHQEIIGRDPEKRVRTLTRKALENAVEEKHREVDVVHKMLRETMQSIEELNEGSDFVTALRHLEGVSAEFKIKIEELQNLYSQDRNSYLGSEEPLLTSESLTLDQARKLVEKIKSRQSDKLLETRSHQSRLSPKRQQQGKAQNSKNVSPKRNTSVGNAKPGLSGHANRSEQITKGKWQFSPPKERSQSRTQSLKQSNRR